MKPIDAALVPFSVVQHAVAAQFERMKNHPLFTVDLTNDDSLNSEQIAACTGDALWNVYLASFPPGTDPIYRQRTDHDCQCCKSFIRRMGAVVALIDGQAVSLWDFPPTGTYYDAVAQALSTLLHSAPIAGLFLHTEKTVGAEKSFAQITNLAPQTEAQTWHHFFLRLPQSVVVAKVDLGPRFSAAQATHDVFLRGLLEISLEAIDTVLELIAQNSLYRGVEHEGAVKAFRDLKVQFDALVSPSRSLAELFAWEWTARSESPAVLRIRNTAIGTLLQDISEGRDLNAAVAAFELKVAPTNYKRPTALVTKAMIGKAQSAIEALGLASALERRYAVLEDISVNDVLFVSRDSERALRKKAASADEAFSVLTRNLPEPLASLGRVEEVPIATFIEKLLPKAQSLEVLFENRHAGNLVSLIAPVDPGSKPLFKWPSRFSWSYVGDVTDSIKERVKRAGGVVTGDLCCRLAWDYSDDLDFHMQEPFGGSHIDYRTRRQRSVNGGVLDLDANGADGPVAEPAENIYYADKTTMREGVYKLSVNNFARRSVGTGFEVEIEFGGQKHNLVYPKALRTHETVAVAEIVYSKRNGFEIKASIPSTQISKSLWGLQTQTFNPVSLVCLSPNYWGASGVGIGNKHYFFMLEGCKNEAGARGFYNEFLAAALEPHRKVLELVGSRMRTDESSRQLSGLGFSSSQKNSVLVWLRGAFERVVRVVF